MTDSRKLLPILCLFAAGVGAQPTPRPAPVAAPAPPAPPVQSPRPAPEPLPALAADWEMRLAESQARMADLDMRLGDMALGPMAAKIDGTSRMIAELNASFAPQFAMGRAANNDDRRYENGQRALENHRWDEALDNFSQVASHAGSRADGALYWKAYTLNKLGRRDEAVAAVAELRKSYPNSRWSDDAKALEIEVKQAAGQNVAPESESDEELKLIALNGLMQSDPERALPLLERLLKSAQPPRLKRNAVFVLAQSSSPKAQQLLEQVARGQGNPDLQLIAIRYLGERRKQGSNNNAALLSEIYGSSNDVNVKRAILSAFAASRDEEHLQQIVRTEKSRDLQVEAIRMLGSAFRGKVEDAYVQRTATTLIALYTPEQDPVVKRAIIDALQSQRNVKGLVQVARTERDPKLKQQIVERLAGMKSPEATDYLMEILK